MLNKFYDRFIFSNTLRFRHNNFFLVDIPFLIMPNDIIAGVLCNEDAEFSRLLYWHVKDSVQKNLCKRFDVGFGLKNGNLVRFIEDFISYSGWGKLQTMDLDFKKKRAIIHLRDNPFAVNHSKKPIDHVMRGILAGFFSGLFNEEMDCVETKCCSCGKENCEFILKKAKDFDFSNQEVRRQLRV